MKLPFPKGTHTQPEDSQAIYTQMLEGMPGYQPPVTVERAFTLPWREVQQLLLGTKSEFRLPVEPQPYHNGREWFWNTDFENQTAEESKRGFLGAFAKLDNFLADLADFCPVGRAGDMLWLQERHRFEQTPGRILFFPPTIGEPQPYTYAPQAGFNPGTSKTRGATQLPKFASRLKLKIMQVRAERLQDITPLGVKNEGITGTNVYDKQSGGKVWTAYPQDVARQVFNTYWDARHPTRPVQSNPFVFVVSFLLVAAPATPVAAPGA